MNSTECCSDEVKVGLSVEVDLVCVVSDGFGILAWFGDYVLRVVVDKVVGGNGKAGFNYEPARRFSIDSTQLKIHRKQASVIKRIVTKLKICQ